MSDRLAPLVVARGFRSYLDLYYLLKFDDRADAAWRDVMDALSVQETYFWREIDQVRALTCHVLPELARVNRGRPIRIWSSPCATGEEPLTIAMALEEGGWFDRVPIEIHGSDGSPLAISRARAGVYRQRSFRALPDYLREKYFTARGADLAPVEALTRRISSWTVVNLMERDAGAFACDEPGRVLPERVHLFFAPDREASRLGIRGGDARARVSIRRRVGVALENLRPLRARGRRASLRLCQTVSRRS